MSSTDDFPFPVTSGVSVVFFGNLPKSGAVTIASCLVAIKEACPDSAESSQLRALAEAVRFPPRESKGLAKEIANMVVRSEIFSVLPREDRKAFLAASSWTRPYNWLMSFLEPGRRFVNHFIRFKKVQMSEDEQGQACQAAVQAWQKAIEHTRGSEKVGSMFEKIQAQKVAEAKDKNLQKGEMYSTIFSAFSRQIEKTLAEGAAVSRH